ncbi:MAG TPA: hypothetical protein PLD02_14715, partial [Saprospiraceae bacterium]|nr:hypothetical protein [Saprospiraceae bacterium]
MKKLLLLTFLFTSFLCEAQQYLPYIEWQRTLGGNTNDFLKSIAKTSDGGVILGGSSNSGISGIKTQDSMMNDVWVVKLDKNHTIEWQKTIGGSNGDGLNSIQETDDKGFILGANSVSNISGDKTENCYGRSDYWIIKLDSSGNIQWQKTIGGNHEDILNDVKQTTDGGYILGGKSYSLDTSGNKTVFGIEGWDYWIVKMDKLGNIQWQKSFGGDNWDEFVEINQTFDGGYIIGGYSKSNISGTKNENTRGEDDYWIIKIDSACNIEWQKTIGGTQIDYLSCILQTPDSGFIVGGLSLSNISGEKTENRKGNGWDYWILKLKSNGIIDWQKTIGGYDADELKSIKKTNDGGYILAGYSNSDISGDKTEDNIGAGYWARTNYDYWVVKIDSLRNIKWQKTIGGGDQDVLTSIELISDNDLLLGGYSFSNISGDKTENSYGYEDYWIIKLKVIDKPDSILGKIFKAQNSNCIQEVNEKGIPNVILKTESKNFYGISDSSGKYSILTDTGKYTVKQIIPNYALPLFRNVICPSNGMYQNISFTQYGQDTTEINFANDVTLCAYLQVELSQGRMRRCFDNKTTIKYCNNGNVDTTNVQVIVTLPEYVTFVSSSNTNYTISGKKITFNIGNLRANECGTINLITKVDCVNGITGLTQCISAYILPRNKCVDQIQPDYALWDKSEVSVDGRCTGNTARFVIKNIGQNNMTDSSSYRIYKDAV